MVVRIGVGQVMGMALHSNIKNIILGGYLDTKLIGIHDEAHLE